MLEGALVGDTDPRRRIMYAFDLRTRAYTGRTWWYRTDAAYPNAVIGDMTALDQHRFVLIRRDDLQGVEARQKKIYEIDIGRVGADGYLEKRLVLDLLHIPDPRGISLPARPRRIRRRPGLLVPPAVGGEPRGPLRRTAADRQRQQLTGQRRPLDRP